MKTDLQSTQIERPPTPAEPEAEPAASPRKAGVVGFAVSTVAVLLILGAGAAGFRWLVSTKPEATRSTEVSLPPLVEVQTLVAEDLVQEFVGYGSARADREVVLAAESAGQVVELSDGVKDGSHVTPGEVLLRIDDRQYRRQLDKDLGLLAEVEAQLARLDVEHANVQRLIETAEAQVRITRDEHERLNRLHEKNLASKKEWDFARLAYHTQLRELQGYQNQRDLIPARRAELFAVREARRADVELAKIACERCTIVAPPAGNDRSEHQRGGSTSSPVWQIERVMVEVGDRVQIGSEILRMMGTRYIEVPVELPLSARPEIRLQVRCTLTMDSMPGAKWEAFVARLSPAADTHSRTFTAYLEVDNQQQETPLVPGYFLTGHVTGPTLRQVLAIPRGAILTNQVFVAKGGEVHLRHVRVDNLVGERAVISGDVAPGDRVALTNLDVLSEGSPVRLQERDDRTGRLGEDIASGVRADVAGDHRGGRAAAGTSKETP